MLWENESRSLRDLQIHFKNSIFKSEDHTLQIYRHNIFTTFTKRLKNIYPAVYLLVGDEFFANMAIHYIMHHTSLTNNVQDFEHEFTGFLLKFPPANSLPYLSEVACLEWAAYEVAHEKKSESTLDFERLGSTLEISYGNLKFKLHPASRLLAFQYPVLDIWRLCQKKGYADNPVNLDAGGEKILVMQSQLNVTFDKLTEGEFVLLLALKQGLVFSNACALALQVQPELNIDHCLQEHVLHRTIIDFSF